MDKQELEINVVGIATIFNFFGMTEIRFFRNDDGLAPFLTARDPQMNRTFRFFFNATTEQVRRAIIESRKAFGVTV